MNDFPAEMQRSACTIVAAAAAAPVEAGWLTYGIKFLLQILGVPEIPLQKESVSMPGGSSHVDVKTTAIRRTQTIP